MDIMGQDGGLEWKPVAGPRSPRQNRTFPVLGVDTGQSHLPGGSSGSSLPPWGGRAQRGFWGTRSQGGWWKDREGNSVPGLRRVPEHQRGPL